MKINPLIEIEDMDGMPIPKGGSNDLVVRAITEVFKEPSDKPIDTLNRIAEAIRIHSVSKENFTLGGACFNSLMAQFDDEKGLTPEEKFKRGKLAEKIYSAKGEVEVSAEEVAEIKKLIGKAYGQLIVIRTWELLEGKPEALPEPTQLKPDAPKVRKPEKG